MATYYAWDIVDQTVPAVDIVDITPSDTENIVNMVGGNSIVGVRALRANNAGNITVLMGKHGQQRTLSFAAGETRVGQFLRVMDTGTTVQSDSSGDGIEGSV